MSCSKKEGCIDDSACNFESSAEIDDGSCTYTEEYYDCDGVCLSDTDSDGICEVCDYDDNCYETVEIGDQEWMSENLKVTHYNNVDVIPNITNNYDWGSLTSGAYGDYDNIPSNSDTYGRLYNWYTVDDERGICPVDWHVPSDEEYKTLEMYLGMSQSEADDTGYRGTNEGSKLAGNASLEGIKNFV